MSLTLDQIKLKELGPKCQVTLFDVEGQVLESCDTLLKTNQKKPIYEQFDFLLSIQEVIQGLAEGYPLHFELVEWKEQRDTLFGMTFQKTNAQTIQWFIIDKSDERDQILSVQQSRNNASINEELLEIRQKYLESEEKLLRFKNEELIRIQKFKERFFAEVSHEMRTPLNSIAGLVSLLELNERKEDHDYLHALKATSQHLNHIINDVLDLSKVEEGKLQLEKLSFSLQEITDAIIKGFQMISEEKKIYIKSQIDPSVPQFIVADPIRLSQVLYNIIGNAVKFTHKGGITLKIDLKNKQADQYLLGFEIADTGIGMTADSIQKILEPYAQVEGQSYYEYSGTGLGMGIAQRLIEVMGGKLSIESTPGKGTIIGFEMSCTEANKASYSVEDHFGSAATIDASGYKLLFAEDDATSTLLMREQSAKWNLNAHFVSSGKELREELEKNQYDLLVTDIQLGDDNAIDIVKSLRNSKTENSQVPVIFFSGDDESAYATLRQVDNWSFLMKPVNPKSLSLKIREMLSLNPDSALEPVDLTNLIESAQNNMEFVAELIDTILEHLPIDMHKLTDAIKTNNYEAARKVLHKMNPSIGYLGIKSLINMRQQLHDKVSKGQSIENEVMLFNTSVNRALTDLADQQKKLME